MSLEVSLHAFYYFCQPNSRILGDRLSDYMTAALDASSVARSIKMLHESIRSNAIATLSINSVGFELQLPPYLDCLLHPEEDTSDDFERESDNSGSWGSDLSFGWREITWLYLKK